MERQGEAWPDLPYDAWKDTCATLHLWTQIVGKIRLACAPHVNHWWQVPLYLTSRGLTTSPMPYGRRTFQIDFDFCGHRLLIWLSDGASDSFALRPMTVAAFHDELMERLKRLGIAPKIWTMPVELNVEIEPPIPFEKDTVHSAYDAGYAQHFWRALTIAERLFTAFRGRFIGKASPVHFFWGGFDLAVTRFSGRAAPPHPPVPYVSLPMVREAYSHEVSSCGFWPGNGGFGKAAFYSYAYPEPAGFADAKGLPEGAYYDGNLFEFILPYDAVRQAAAPASAVLQFLQASYDAAADCGKWDRAALERATALLHPPLEGGSKF